VLNSGDIVGNYNALDLIEKPLFFSYLLFDVLGRFD
jgi:hypothetical protein